MTKNDWKILELSNKRDSIIYRLRDGGGNNNREALLSRKREIESEIDSLRPADYPKELLFSNQ